MEWCDHGQCTRKSRITTLESEARYCPFQERIPLGRGKERGHWIKFATGRILLLPDRQSAAENIVAALEFLSPRSEEQCLEQLVVQLAK